LSVSNPSVVLCSICDFRLVEHLQDIGSVIRAHIISELLSCTTRVLSLC